MRKIFLVVSCLILLSACSSKIVYVDRYKAVLPPEELLGDCPTYPIRGESVKDLVDLALEYQVTLLLCQADKVALREWREANKTDK